MTNIIAEQFNLINQSTPHIIVTLVRIKGSAPQVEGAKIIVTEKGLYFGTVGGGKIEAHCIDYAKSLISNKRPQSHLCTWNLQTDIGMSCGGEVSLFFEPYHLNPWQIVIFGAGHISQELCRVLTTWSCRVTVFDTRRNWIDRLPRAENIKALCVESLEDQVLNMEDGVFVLSMTQGHATDLPVLKALGQSKKLFGFIGVIGSAVKAKKIKSELCEQGLEKTFVDSIQCPLGLPIGNNTPPEISCSISGQLLAIRDQLKVNL